MRVCPNCQKAVDVSHRCWRDDYEVREKARRRRRSKLIGRTSAHWLSVVARTAKRSGARCARCGTHEDLTAHYNGDHSTAKVAHVLVLCRRCHGRQDGGKRVAS